MSRLKWLLVFASGGILGAAAGFALGIFVKLGVLISPARLTFS